MANLDYYCSILAITLRTAIFTFTLLLFNKAFNIRLHISKHVLSLTHDHCQIVNNRKKSSGRTEFGSRARLSVR